MAFENSPVAETILTSSPDRISPVSKVAAETSSVAPVVPSYTLFAVIPLTVTGFLSTVKLTVFSALAVVVLFSFV